MSLVKGVPVFVVMIAIIVALLGPAFAQMGQQLAASSTQSISDQATAAQAMRVAEEIEADVWNADLAHAVARHGAENVATIQNCLKSKGAAVYMWNPFTDRRASVCLVNGGRFGVEIDDSDGDLVTAFFAKKMKTIQDVIDYLSDGGFLRQ